jgi:formate dehydrogenase alpha subunit
MIAGRDMFHFGSTSTRSANLRLLTPGGQLEVNEDDALALGLSSGDLITVISRAGSFDAAVKLSGDVPKGIVFAPTNFPDVGAYRLLQENTTACNVKLVKRT